MLHRAATGRTPAWLVIAMLMISAPCPVAPGETINAKKLADHIDALLVADEYDHAVQPLARYLEHEPDDARMQFNAACVHAQLGNLERAETHLRLAMKHGFMRFSTFQRDPDLEPLRERTVLKSIIAARDAADGIIASRRSEHWLNELDPRYRVAEDRSRRIDLISALDDQSQQVAQQRIATVADDVAEFFGHELRHRITIVLLSKEDAAPIFGSDRIRGNYRHGKRELIVTNLGRSLQHELAHAFHHSHMDELHQQHPMWVQEGLGCLFEAYRRDAAGGYSFLPNDRHEAIVHLLRKDDAPSWEQLVNASPRQFQHDAMTLYPMCRSVFEFIADRHGAQRWYRRYVRGYASDPRGTSALASVAEVEAEPRCAESTWRQWVLQRAAESPPAASRRAVLTYRPPSDADQPTDDETPHDGPRIVVRVDREARKADELYKQVRPTVLAGAYEQAIPRLEQVVGIMPDHADARYDLALGYIHTGRIDAARQQCQHLRELDASLASMVAACLRSRSNGQ